MNLEQSSNFLSYAIGFGKVIAYFLFIITCALFVQYIQDVYKRHMQLKPSNSFKFVLGQNFKWKKSELMNVKSKKIYVLAPIIFFIVSLSFCYIIPLFPVKDESLNKISKYGLYFSSLCYPIMISLCVLWSWNVSMVSTFFADVYVVIQFICAQLIILMINLIILLSAHSADIAEISNAQEVWYMFKHFPLFLLYIFATLLITGQEPFNSFLAQKSLSGGILSPYFGKLGQVCKLGFSVLFLYMVLLIAYLFMGGTNPVIGFENYGAEVQISLKVLFLLFFMGLIKACLPLIYPAQIIKITYKYIMPFLTVWLFVCMLFQKGFLK
ncbi:MAG: NADH-quinone oxidoreductase subunit H [Alphaproteobacteria bacterium]|nr:NADH-quinone oxidoreductase subunit H [Alphaproteobacteria bacterium]